MKELFLAIILSSHLVISEGLVLDVKVLEERIKLGEPIYIEWVLRNESKEGIKVAMPAGYWQYYIKVYRESGEEVQRNRVMDEHFSLTGEYEIELLIGGDCKRLLYDLSINYELGTGRYYIYAIYKQSSPLKNARTHRYEEVWSGEIKSNRVELQVEEPQGEEREAYEYFKGHIPLSGERSKEVLEKFPTSTYAGWVVEKYLYKPSETDVEWFYNKLEFKQGVCNSVPTRDGWKQLTGKDYLNWQKGWAEEILKNHPDFAMAENLKLLLAVINYWEGNKEKGKDWLDKLSKESKEYKWGRKFFEYIEQKSKEKEKEIIKKLKN